MDKYAVIIVTYNPSPKDIEYIKSLLQYVPFLLIVANSDIQSTFFNDYPANNLFTIINKKNVGLAAALNIGVEQAGELGYEDIFLFDQDSRVDNSFFEQMLTFRESLKSDNIPYGFIVPDYFDIGTYTHAKFSILTKCSFHRVSCRDISSFTSPKAILSITSGMLIPYTNYQKIGPLKDDYFIDMIDIEYCLRTYAKGFQIGISCNAVMKHTIGRRCEQSKFNIVFRPNYHPAFRKYYFARNGIATVFTYIDKFPAYFILFCLQLIHDSLSILFFENQKRLKFYAIIRGLFDGVKKKLGICRNSLLIN